MTGIAWSGLWDGLRTTVEIGLSSIVVTLVLGFLLALGRRSVARSVAFGATAFVEFIRANSAIVLLFWVFYAVPLLPGHWLLGVSFSAIAVLGATGAAYASEVIRGAIDAVPRGQLDACEALGLGFWRRELRIVLPQAVPMALPSLSSICVEVLKWSAAASLVTAQDVVAWAQAQRSQSAATTTVYLTLIALFFVMGRIIAGCFELAGRLMRHRGSKAARAGEPASASRRGARSRQSVDIGLPLFFPKET